MKPEGNQKLPKKITPDPIVEAVVEIRFVPKVKADAVMHFVSESQVIKESFSDPEELPIYQFPPSVRNSEPLFQYSPHFRLKGLKAYANYVAQVGPRVLSIVTANEYQGSDDFLHKANALFSSVNDHGAIDQVERLGIRYIDFFDSNIFDNVKLTIDLPEQELTHNNTSLRIEFPSFGGFTRTLHLNSNAKVFIAREGKEKTGSLLDVDAFTNSIRDSFFGRSEELIREGHLAQKHLFFGLLKEEFLKSLNPIY